MNVVPTVGTKYVGKGGSMLAKFISACGGVSYRTVPENINEYFVHLRVSSTGIIYEDTPGYSTMRKRRYLRCDYKFDELHGKVIPIFREFLE